MHVVVLLRGFFPLERFLKIFSTSKEKKIPQTNKLHNVPFFVQSMIQDFSNKINGNETILLFLFSPFQISLKFGFLQNAVLEKNIRIH